jgi:hypothetical protein
MFIHILTDFGTYTNFYEYIKYYEIKKRIKKEKLRVGWIRPEAEGLLGVAASCGSGPSRPHGPTGVAQQPLSPAGSGAAWRTAVAGGSQSGDEVRGNQRGQLAQEEGKVPGKAGPMGVVFF